MSEQWAIALGILAVNFPLVIAYVVAERRGWIDGPSAVAAKKLLLAEKDEEIDRQTDELDAGRKARVAKEQEIRAECDARVAYVEARRKEERDGRIAAEKRVTMLTEATREITGLLQDVRVEIARGSGHAGG